MRSSVMPSTPFINSVSSFSSASGVVPGSRRQSRIAEVDEGMTLGAEPFPSKPVTWQVSVTPARVGGLASSFFSAKASTSAGRCMTKPENPPFFSPVRRSSSYIAG
jgi:hypothetical protein